MAVEERTLALQGNVLRDDGRIVPGCVVLKHGTIDSVGSFALGASTTLEVLHFPAGSIIAPGFIDIQLNGAFGHDFTVASAGILDVARQLPRYGVTSFLPTVITSPLDNIRKMISEVKAILRSTPGEVAAEILGLHVEGPFLAPGKAGAHDSNYCLPPIRDYLVLFDPSVVRLLTLAPELEGCLDFIAEATRSGIVVGMGHSNATFQQTLDAVASGASWGTHLFNAAPMLDHREPGLVGALLADPRLRFALIADGLHLHPAILRIAYAAKGAQGVTLISDSTAATGMPPGIYLLGETPITVDGASSRAVHSGGLAGSVLTLDAAVRNMIRFSGCSIAAALTMASTSPADVIRHRRKGRILPGYDGDLVVLDPSLHVIATVTKGRVAYRDVGLAGGS